MQINFLTKNYKLGDHLKSIIEEKLAKLDKYFEDNTPIKVRLKEGNGYNKLELTIILGSIVLRSEVITDDMYKAIDLALPKLERQVVKHFSKFDAKYKRGAELPPPIVETAAAVVRNKTFVMQPMTVAEALVEIDRVEHDFYVFLCKETKKVNVVYKRKDGDYGLIEAS
ncbi:MAG: ribosome-associated translation inhibitor RaiA [Firmicutes bacterium]|nr:ribosome-associated translation inhibitor RaiA [Bacillota bacterium]